MISVVLNHELHLLARCDRYAPRSTLWVHPEPPACEPLDDAELARLRAEITAKVHPRAPRSGGVLRLPAPGPVT